MPGRDLSEDEQAFNALINCRRIIVENCFAMVKTFRPCQYQQREISIFRWFWAGFSLFPFDPPLSPSLSLLHKSLPFFCHGNSSYGLSGTLSTLKWGQNE